MLLLLAVGFFIIGLSAGAMIENYRARVKWGFPLGPEWSPPKERR